MGSPRDIMESHILAMKILYIVGSFLAAQAAAEAEPEANPNAEANSDPWYSYGYGLGNRYGGYGHYGYSAYRPHYGGYGYWGRKKREAEPTAAANARLRLMLSLGTLPMDMVVDTMDMADTLPIGHTTVMVDIEDTDIMERSNLSTISRSAFDNSPVTIAHFNRYLFL